MTATTGKAVTVNKIPKYRLIKNEFLRGLHNKLWKVGTQIPTEPELAKQFGVSVGTIRKAVDELVEENILIRYQGRGTFVKSYSETKDWNRFHVFQYTNGHLTYFRSRTESVGIIPATQHLASLMGLHPGDSIIRITRKLYDSSYRAFDEVYLKPEMFPAITPEELNEVHGNLYRFYEERFGVTIVDSVDSLEVEITTRKQSDLTGFSEGTPAFVLTRVSRGFLKEPIEVRICHMRSEGVRVLLSE